MYSPGVSEVFHTTIITYPFLVLVDLFPTSSFLISLLDGDTESKLEAGNSGYMPEGDKIKAILKVYRFQNWYMLLVSPGLLNTKPVWEGHSFFPIETDRYLSGQLKIRICSWLGFN